MEEGDRSRRGAGRKGEGEETGRRKLETEREEEERKKAEAEREPKEESERKEREEKELKESRCAGEVSKAEAIAGRLDRMEEKRIDPLKYQQDIHKKLLKQKQQMAL